MALVANLQIAGPAYAQPSIFHTELNLGRHMEKTTKSTFDRLQEAHVALQTAQQRNDVTARLNDIQNAVRPAGQSAMIVATVVGTSVGAVAGVAYTTVELFQGVISGGILGALLGFASLRTGAIYSSGGNGARYAAIAVGVLFVSIAIGLRGLGLTIVTLVGMSSAIYGYVSGRDIFSDAEVNRRVFDLQAQTSAELDQHMSRLGRLKAQVISELEAMEPSTRDKTPKSAYNAPPVPAE